VGWRTKTARAFTAIFGNDKKIGKFRENSMPALIEDQVKTGVRRAIKPPRRTRIYRLAPKSATRGENRRNALRIKSPVQRRRKDRLKGMENDGLRNARPA